MSPCSPTVANSQMARMIKKCNRSHIRTLVLSTEFRFFREMQDVFGKFPNLKELTCTENIFYKTNRSLARIPVVDTLFWEGLITLDPLQTNVEVINVFLSVDWHQVGKESRTDKRKELRKMIAETLRFAPNLKQLNVYNASLDEQSVNQLRDEIFDLMKRKRDILDKAELGQFQEARALILGGVGKYNLIRSLPLTTNEDLALNIYPCFHQPNISLAFDNLSQCGLSPRTYVKCDDSRSYLYLVLHVGPWVRRKRYLSELYTKYHTEFFSWFRVKDWNRLLGGETCKREEFIAFFLPKFTKFDFMRVLSPSVLKFVGDYAYPVIQQMPVYGFDFKWIPNLLAYVENAPLLYQLFCDHGCSLKGQKIIPQHYLKCTIGPCVLHKVLEESDDLTSNKEFMDQLFTILGASDEYLPLLALDKIGSQNVQSYLDLNGNTYLHVALTEGRLELARTMIRRYGVSDVNHMNNNKETILHIACRSIRCLPNIIELLLDMPGIKTYLKNESGKYAYDIMLRTISSNKYPRTICADILRRLCPEEAIQVDQMIAKVNNERTNSDDPDFSLTRKRKAVILTSYKRHKRAKGDDESRENIRSSKESLNCMSLREKTKRFSEYP